MIKSLQISVGKTPLIEIEGIYFKCEYENPTGSHKDRSFATTINKLVKNGIGKAVISSSGNAAISAATYCRNADISLTVFVSPHINKNKLKVLEGFDCEIIRNDKPVSEAFKFAKENDAYNLRQSTDPEAALGYEDIAREIVEGGVEPDGVFLPVSSGVTLLGIYHGFAKLQKNVPMHAVQTDRVYPIAGLFDKYFKKTTEKSLADAIVARFTPLCDEVVSIIKQSGGGGWVIGNGEMHLARKWLLSHKIVCSYEGAAALAALWKAKKNGYKFDIPVCLLTGRYY